MILPGGLVKTRLANLAAAAFCLALAACGANSTAPAQCAANEQVCNGVCVDIATSAANCGQCNHACVAPGNGGTTSCVSGACVPACASPLGLCNVRDNGGTATLSCTDTSTDRQNCGSCGTACGQSQLCDAGHCDALAPGMGTCDNLDGGAGTTVDLLNDPQNCGSCGNACAANEVCKNGGCDPCPVARCGNECVDTLRDPKNCGACGTTVPYCDNGTSLAKISIELLAPLSMTPASSFVKASGSMPFSIRVHSGLRVARVTIKTAADIASLGAATATDLAPPTIESSTTTWSGSFTVIGAAGATMAIQLDAYDEQYMPSLGSSDAKNTPHFDEKQFTAKVTAVPTATTTAISATVGGTLVGSGTACGGRPCMWVPLNAGPMTLSAQVAGAPANGVAAIEFHNANSPGANGSLLCPSRAPAAPGAPTPSCAQAVNGSGIATLTLNSAEVGKGDTAIFACGVDATGLQTGPCTQMTVPSVCGSGGVSACPANFTIGRVASCPVSAPCAMAVPPAMGRNVDTPANHSLYYLAFTDPTAATPNQLPGLFAQDAVTLNGNGNGQPGTRVGTNTYFATGLLATAEGSGVYGVRCAGVCTTAPAPTAGSDQAVDRIDCPNAGSTTCFKASFVTTSAAIRQIHVATDKAMLLTNNLPPATTTGGANGFFATALSSQTTAAGLAMGTLLDIKINGVASATTGKVWGTTTSGAIVAVFSGTTPTACASSGGCPWIYHPSLPGNHAFILPNNAGASTSNFDLVVFPGGEIVYTYSDDTNNHYIGAAYYDGTATTPKFVATPLNYGGSGTGTAKNFIVAAPGILLGEIPAAGSATNFQAVEINLFAGTGTAPTITVPIAFGTSNADATTTGVLHEGGVFARTGVASNFAVSDDRTRAIFVTDDPPLAGPPPPRPIVFRLHLIKLSDSSQIAIASSERLLCALTGSDATITNCAVNAGGAAHYPRFVHSAPVYAGAAPSGIHQALVWEEEEPFASSQAVRHARLSFANFSGAGTITPGSADRLLTYSPSQPFPEAYEVESAAGGAIYFLSANDFGGSDLYSVPLTPPTTSPVPAAKVLDDVNGFKVREETTPAHLIASRADGTLYYAPLPGGGANPASGLMPIARNGVQGSAQYGVIPPSTSYGFTPDGYHVFTVVDQQFYLSGPGYWGVLETVDLTQDAGFARTNWGRIVYSYPSPLPAGFISNATAGEVMDTSSVENIALGRLNVVLSSNPTRHGDTGMFFDNPTSPSSFVFSPSLDGSEAMFGFAAVTEAAPTGTAAASPPLISNTLSANGTFLDTSGTEVMTQAATNSPFGGPYRPEYSQIDGNFFTGASSSIFKVWGTTAPASTPPSFVTLLRGAVATPSSSPRQTRQTPDNKDLVHSFADAADVNGKYAIFLPLSGRKPPDPLTP